MISIQKEEYLEVIEDIKPLVYEHGSETDLYQEHFTVDPDFEVYSAMDSNGTLQIFTARDEGKLVGYLVFFVSNHPHYKNTKYASNDLLYVHPDYRKGGLIQNLFAFAEEYLKEDGVQVMTFHFKSHMDHPALAEIMGYDRAEVMYSKYIEGN